uniref:Uncharacterized protein n=1 Tax=Anguilla anguilla TaxID=7936 RepID=A0A0E9QNB8_ANGAN
MSSANGLGITAQRGYNERESCELERAFAVM